MVFYFLAKFLILELGKKKHKNIFLLGLQLVWYQFLDILVGLGIRCFFLK